MLIGLLLLLIVIIGFVIPQKYQKRYYIIIAFVLATLLLFYKPPETDDLYRYYKMFDIVKTRSFLQCINRDFGITDDWYYEYMLNDYMQNSQAYMLIIFVLSRIGIKQLVVFAFCIGTYIPLFVLADKIGTKNGYNKVAINIGYALILFCVDFRFITCLRNIMAYANFVLLLYCDFNEKNGKKKILYFLGYIILCQIHMSCTVLLGIRVLILLFKNKFKLIFSTAFLTVGFYVTFISYVLNRFFGKFEYAVRLAKRVLDYYLGRTNYNINGALFFVTSILVAIITVFYVSKLKKPQNNNLINGIDSNFTLFFWYVTFFTFGSIRQYDVLTRNVQLIVILAMPYIMSFFNNCEILEEGHINFKIKNRWQILSFFVCLSCVGLMLVSLLFYTLFSYVPMQKGF